MEQNIRNLINGVYDIQKLRIATGNRVVAALRGIIEDTDNAPKTEEQRAKEQKEKDSILKENPRGVQRHYHRLHRDLPQHRLYRESYFREGPRLHKDQGRLLSRRAVYEAVRR